MNADEALDLAQTWQALPNADDAAHALAAEVVRLQERVVDLESTVKGTLEAVGFGHAVTVDSRLYRELRAVLFGRGSS